MHLLRRDEDAPGDSRHSAIEACEVQVHFAGLRALDGVDLRLEQGQIMGLIGPNGAGKTTFVNCVSGFQRPTTGRVYVAGREVTRAGPRRMNRLGVARTFQGGRLFRQLSVFDNVRVACLASGASGRGARQTAASLLTSAAIDENDWTRPAGALPYGAQRRVGVVRALACSPRFLMLDEPAAGMNEAETDELLDQIVRIREQFGCGVLLIEHDMRLIFKVCEQLTVLDHGKTLCVGRPEEVRTNAAVIAAYLGSRSDA